MDFIGKKWEQKMERWFYFDIDWGKLLLLKGQQKNFEKMMERELLRELLVIMNILQTLLVSVFDVPSHASILHSIETEFTLPFVVIENNKNCYPFPFTKLRFQWISHSINLFH